MRWWLNTDHKTFAVDNSSVQGMDFSTLSPDIWMIQWTDGHGEIERQTTDGDNLNGLRERFIDVTPYAPLFRQFLALVPGLLLPQAQQIQLDLIDQLYDSKRQAPITSASHSWDASDKEMADMAAKMGQASGATSAEALVPKINTAFASVVSQSNGIYAGIIAQTNAALYNSIVSVNNAFVADASNGTYWIEQLRAAIWIYVSNQINAYISQLHNEIASFNAIDISTNDANINTSVLTGRAIDIPAVGTWTAPGAAADAAPGGFAMTGISITGGSNPTPSITWPPLDQTTPVTLTYAQYQALLKAINDRRVSLNDVKLSKRAAVKAMTTVAAVIAYDVTAGW